MSGVDPNDFEYVPNMAALAQILTELRVPNPQRQIVERLTALLDDRDRQLEDFLGSWRDITDVVSLTQGTSISIDTSVSSVLAAQLGRRAIVNGYLLTSSAGTASNPLLLTLPTWLSHRLGAPGQLINSGTVGLQVAGSPTVNRVGIAFPSTAANVFATVVDNATGRFGVNPTTALTSGSVYSFQLVYPLATTS